jgi:hypothetical protein
MARRHPVTRRALSQLADGPIARAVESLWHNRLTSYQDLCLHLGRLAIDLPTARHGSWVSNQLPLHRHTDRYPSGSDLIMWVLEVAQQNLLAGVVLIDALDWFGDILSFVAPSRKSRFPEREDKKEWTQRVGEYFLEFEVPEGWEFNFHGDVHAVGHRGVALVRRCHLSESWYHADSGGGRLVVAEALGVERAIGFDIPCEYVPALRVDQETLQVGRADGGYGYAISLPYAFVIRAFRRPWNREEKLAFVPRPADQEVVDLAQGSIARIQERWRKIAAERSSTTSFST